MCHCPPNEYVVFVLYFKNSLMSQCILYHDWHNLTVNNFSPRRFLARLDVVRIPFHNVLESGVLLDLVLKLSEIRAISYIMCKVALHPSQLRTVCVLIVVYVIEQWTWLQYPNYRVHDPEPVSNLSGYIPILHYPIMLLLKELCQVLDVLLWYLLLPRLVLSLEQLPDPEMFEEIPNVKDGIDCQCY